MDSRTYDGNGGYTYINAFGMSSSQGYNGYGDYGLSAVFWGSPAMQFEQSYEGHNGIQITTDPSQIFSILSYYSRQSGEDTITWWGTDANGQYEVGYEKHKTQGGSDRISGRYGGDGSGSLMDYVHKFLYATDQINPIALAWDGFKAKFTGSDRFGNTLTPFESSSKIAAAIPIGKFTNTSTSVLSHIFRNAVGHVNPSTVTSQMRYFALFEKVASNPNNIVPTANAAARAAGVITYNQTYRNGTVWVQVVNGTIRNAGVNIP